MSLARKFSCTGRTQARENVKGPRVIEIGLIEHPGLLLGVELPYPVPKQKIPLTLGERGALRRPNHFSNVKLIYLVRPPRSIIFLSWQMDLTREFGAVAGLAY